MSLEKKLGALRRDIDDIDVDIHDLLIRRTKVVEKVRDLKHGQKVKIRAAREAEILYRLMSRHTGLFPKRELANIWRTIIVATLSIEGPFSIAVYMPESEPGYWDLARLQYGMFAPLTAHTSSRQVIEDVLTQRATLGILPLPRLDDPDPWWRFIATNTADAPKILARLPFAGAGNSRSGEFLEALVICPMTQEKTGRDRSYVGIELEKEIGSEHLAAAFSEFKLPVVGSAVWKDRHAPNAWLYLVEIDDFVAANDSRLALVRENFDTPVNQVLTLGGYATVLTEEELALDEGESVEEG